MLELLGTIIIVFMCISTLLIPVYFLVCLWVIGRNSRKEERKKQEEDYEMILFQIALEDWEPKTISKEDWEPKTISKEDWENDLLGTDEDNSMFY